MKTVSGKAFAKVLEGQGWVLSRVRGSHHVYKKPGEMAALAVPVHGNDLLKTGLLVALLKQAGLTEDDLPGGQRKAKEMETDEPGEAKEES